MKIPLTAVSREGTAMPSATTRHWFLLSVTLISASGCYSMNGYVMNASGQGYYEKGNYALAAQEFQTALANNPSNPDYMANLAKARMKMGDAVGAEQLYRQALTASPSHQPSYHGYAELLTHQNRGQEALKMLTAWAATQPYIAESHVELAWIQRELGQPEAAARSLQTALQVNPNHSTALAHLGQYYQDAGHPEQAIALYQQSLESDWNQPEVQTRLASAASSSGANHPMNRIAMERGVHPHELPPQQLATQMPFGAGPQQVAYQQSGVWPVNPSPVATMNPAFAASPYPPANTQPLPLPQPAFNHAAAMPGQPMPGQPLPMNFAASSTVAAQSLPMAPFSAGVSSQLPPSPVPDPAFANASSETTVPVTSISHRSSTTDAPPEVEAF